MHKQSLGRGKCRVLCTAAFDACFLVRTTSVLAGLDLPPHFHRHHLGSIPHPSYLDYSNYLLSVSLIVNLLVTSEFFQNTTLTSLPQFSRKKIYPGVPSFLCSLVSVPWLEHGVWCQAHWARISALLLTCCVTSFSSSSIKRG